MWSVGCHSTATEAWFLLFSWAWCSEKSFSKSLKRWSFRRDKMRSGKAHGQTNAPMSSPFYPLIPSLPQVFLFTPPWSFAFPTFNPWL